MSDLAFELPGDRAPFDARRRASDRARDDEANRAMDRYAAGDEAAFSALYDAIAPRLHGFLIRQLRDRSHAEDVLQNTMLHIHCARASYVSGAEVVPWAFAIARNLVIDAHRRRRTRREVALDDADGAGDRPSIEPSPDETARSHEAAQTIARVLATLPEPQRLAFELLKYDGLSLAEAADVLGASIGAVKVRAHRTYEALRAALAK
jgi:RNA polymerase sigma-70 factor (ECF subfamily)